MSRDTRAPDRKRVAISRYISPKRPGHMPRQDPSRVHTRGYLQARYSKGIVRYYGLASGGGGWERTEAIRPDWTNVRERTQLLTWLGSRGEAEVPRT